MRAYVLTGICLLAVMALASSGLAAETKGNKGGELFKKHCAVCHANGGNTVNKEKTLSKKDREANGVLTVNDIILTIRSPGQGMPKFDAKTVSTEDARAIAEYVIATFK